MKCKILKWWIVCVQQVVCRIAMKYLDLFALSDLLLPNC